ncbi:hypothetical protein XELAEV_18013989mg [Xenopus laevis]|uniref:Vacuolar protein sorting-associated protein 16 homolog n=1 Tax=Xenopus laevis TaxID=8355 RepID=A0A974DQU0_XENLA|nr:hypothetical protein XELAEV_18013989mg [Xenopus laevis]
MEWELREVLRECLVAAGPYAGTVALMRNPCAKEKSGRPILEIYSASGLLLSSFPWKSGLVDGTVLLYDLFCSFKCNFSLGSEVKQNQVLEAKVFHTKYRTDILTILTGALKFTIASNIDDVKLRSLPEIPGLRGPPSCWTVLFNERVPLVLAAVGPDLYLLDNTTAFTSDVRQTPKQMTRFIRPGSRNIALALMWEKLLFLVGRASEGVHFPLDEPPFLVPELDGVRIIPPSTHELFHEIPKVTEDIFKIVSMAPGALLLEAQKEYEKESQKADDYLREIKDQNLLSEAVENCIEAAGNELTPEMQKSLLRAASFGKCFVEKYSPADFVTMCQDLRILNAIHDYQIGMPLTITQYKQLTVQVLLDRLGVSWIFAHYACYKVQQKEKSDDEIAQAINQKLGNSLGISYSEIASRACECGRTELPIKLLEYEPKSEDQSGDMDLAYIVVTYMKNEFNRGDFFMTLPNHPVALSLYRQFCKHHEPETLKDLYNQCDNHLELGNFYVRSSYGTEKRVEGRVAELQNAVEEYNKAKNKVDKPYLDFSLHDTVYNLILEGMHKKAEQLYIEFNIPDKRYWWLKISALAEKEDWEELENFSKKSATEQRNEKEMNLMLSRCTSAADNAIAEKINPAKSQILKK